jgi:hypothetical protein
MSRGAVPAAAAPSEAPSERHMTEADLPSVYFNDLVMEGAETIVRKDPQTKRYSPRDSHIMVQAYPDRNFNGRKDDGETGLLFGVREEVPTQEALERSAKTTRTAGRVYIREPPRNNPLMVTDETPGYEKMGDTLVFDRSLVRYSLPSAVAADPNIQL